MGSYGYSDNGVTDDRPGAIWHLCTSVEMSCTNIQDVELMVNRVMHARGEGFGPQKLKFRT